MNATFETIRKELKKYNAEDNDAPPKLIVADKNDFLNIEHKRKKTSQFIIAVKEFVEPEKHLVARLLDDLEMKTGRRPLAFFYNSKEAVETSISDFEDYYNRPLGKDVFQKVGSSAGQGELQYYLIIVVLETYYYES
jgi:predicted DNA-binding protein